MVSQARQPTAIVGIGCRFATAASPHAFWELLRDGVDAIREVPADRFDIDAVFDPTPGTPGKTVSRWGSFVPGVAEFDAPFFGISPREAARMDPQQRLLLEAAWEALEDAGIVPAELAGSATGVFVGLCYNDYEDLSLRDPSRIDIYTATGGFRSVAAGRISWALGLEGPSLAIDTACSSSLVAVHLACQSLRSGECGLALAGGVNLILQPEFDFGFSAAGMLAPDGRCKFGDASANGFVRSDGLGVVVLKPLAQALRDGDPIYAVIRGSAVNNDGRGAGAMATPSRSGQEAALRAAHRDAGVSPGRVQYVEAHGTGTAVGDPVELCALGAVLGEGRDRDAPCWVGSVKTNIGHAEGAAGIAGLIKTALSLHRRAIPASLHFATPNPEVPWRELALRIPRKLESWPERPDPALAGVSSFGISGVNAHLILEQAPGREWPARPPGEAGDGLLLPLSARCADSLRRQAAAFLEYLEAEDLESDGPRASDRLRDVCYSAAVRRSHHEHRLAVTGSPRQIVERLRAFAQGDAPPGLHCAPRAALPGRKLAFVFPGQGSQWLGMGRELLEREPAFREQLEACDAAIRRCAGWSLLEALRADADLGGVDRVQPCIFAVQTGLAALWRDWGIEPDAVVGHSLGEVAAANVAGILTLDDAARVVCVRSRVVRERSPAGAMAVVELSFAEAQRALRGFEGRVCVAAGNSETSSILSGEPEAVAQVRARLDEREVFSRAVNVDYASHGPQMDALLPELLAALEGLAPRSAALPFHSTVTGEIEDGSRTGAEYWGRNLRDPVRFHGAVQKLIAEGHEILLEISPHPVLLGALRENLAEAASEGVALPSLRRDEPEAAALLDSLCALYVHGGRVDWRRRHRGGGRPVRLPTHPWNRQHLWIEEGGARRPAAGRRLARHGALPAERAHPFLVRHLRSALHEGTHFWEVELSCDTHPFLADHRIGERAVFPAAGYAELALAAVEELHGRGAHVLEGLRFERALALPERASRLLQIALTPAGHSALEVRFLSAPGSDEQGAPSEGAGAEVVWTLHAHGRVRVAAGAESAAERLEPAAIRARCGEELSADDHYAALAARSIHYGPSFRGVERVWKGKGEAIGRIRAPDPVARQSRAYGLHPALLDACFQVLATALAGPDGQTWVPVALERLRRFAPPCDELWAHARRSADREDEGDVVVSDRDGRVLFEARGLRLRRLEREEADPRDCVYELRWQRAAPLPAADLRAGGARPWLLLADADELGAALAARLRAGEGPVAVATPGARFARSAPGRYELRPTAGEDYERLLREAFPGASGAGLGVVHLWSAGAPALEASPDAPRLARERTCESVVHLVRALSAEHGPQHARLWLVSRGAELAGSADAALEPSQAPLWGLARVIANEHPELGCIRVDLPREGAVAAVESLARELRASEGEEEIALRASEGEEEIALRASGRWVQRLVRSDALAGAATGPTERSPAGDRPFRLTLEAPGSLDRLALCAAQRRSPGPGELELRVSAAGLNFRDVMVCLGLIPAERPIALGFECTGTIVAVGAGVEGFEPGDRVLAVTPGSFSRYVTADARACAALPAGLGFEAGTTLGCAFLTAHHALGELARLRAGERVLVHSAAGGVGLAAVQLAQRAGAEVFATAGTPEKRAFLRSLGVEHVFDSRSLDFADEIARATSGEGVDVVLNSLAGEAIPKSLSLLRPFGRFVELGKRDIHADGRVALRALENNLSFHVIDLNAAIRGFPERVGQQLRECLALLSEGEVQPLPHRVFPVSRVEEAFRTMSQGAHIGRIVIDFEDPRVEIEGPRDAAALLREDGTYLVSGGLGALGLAAARRLSERGARHLLLLGRRPPGAAARTALAELAAAGARVEVLEVDVADGDALARGLARVRQTLPPLRGVLHAAAVLDDGIVESLDANRFAAVMAPKVDGAWQLHRLTLGDPLDFFVLFSSAAGVLGSPGQANYAAANAFLDAFAHHRRSRGLPAQSIAWGPWSEIGLAAADAGRGERLERRGLEGLSPALGLELFERLLPRRTPHVCAMRFSRERWVEFHPAAASSSLLRELAGGASSSAEAPLRQELLALPGGPERRRRLESELRREIGEVLRLPAASLDPRRALKDLGLDSLMAVELRNRIGSRLGLRLSATLLFNHPTLEALVPELAQRIGLSLEAEARRPRPTSDEALSSLLSTVAGMSQDELDALVARPRGAADPRAKGERDV